MRICCWPQARINAEQAQHVCYHIPLLGQRIQPCLLRGQHGLIRQHARTGSTAELRRPGSHALLLWTKEFGAQRHRPSSGCHARKPRWINSTPSFEVPAPGPTMHSNPMLCDQRAGKTEQRLMYRLLHVSMRAHAKSCSGVLKHTWLTRRTLRPAASASASQRCTR